MIESSLSFAFAGQKLELSVNIPYSEKKCIKLPENCLKCPNGYMNDCGRNIPFKPEDYEKRPETCKLEQINIRKLIELELQKLGV